jgi:hypothetical protein
MARLLSAVVVVAAVALASWGAVARADYVYGYAGPGAWFSPGDGYGSAYDSPCYPWVGNNFAKADSSWGLVTAINTSGGWSYTKQGYGNLSPSIPTSSYWVKKLHCKNNSSTRYQGGCFGFRRQVQCV